MVVNTPNVTDISPADDDDDGVGHIPPACTPPSLAFPSPPSVGPELPPPTLGLPHADTQLIIAIVLGTLGGVLLVAAIVYSVIKMREDRARSQQVASSIPVRVPPS